MITFYSTGSTLWNIALYAAPPALLAGFFLWACSDRIRDWWTLRADRHATRHYTAEPVIPAAPADIAGFYDLTPQDTAAFRDLTVRYKESGRKTRR